MSWERVDAAAAAEHGVTYRSWYVIDFPYSTAVADATSAALMAFDRLAPDRLVKVRSFDIWSPETRPRDLPLAQDYLPRSAWVLRVTWEKASDSTPVHVLAAAVIAVIAAVVIGWTVIATVTERQAREFGGGVKDILGQLLSPGFVVAALIATVTIFRGRKA